MSNNPNSSPAVAPESTNISATLRRQKYRINSTFVVVAGVVLSVLIPALLFPKGGAPTIVGIFFLLALTIYYFIYTVALSPKYRVRLEDDTLVEERDGVEERTPILDITSFDVITNYYGGVWMDLKFKGRSGTYRYTPLKLYGDSFQSFLDFGEELEAAIDEKNIGAQLDSVSGMTDPALIQAELNDTPPVFKHKWRSRMRSFYTWSLISVAFIGYCVIMVREIKKGEAMGYFILAVFIGMPLYYIGQSIWRKRKLKNKTAE